MAVAATSVTTSVSAVAALALSAVFGACGSPAPAASAPPTGVLRAAGPVDVLYAASLEHLMATGIGPAFDAASGASFTGFAGGSDALANEIKGKVRQADVFVSASPSVDSGLEGSANGGWVRWYASLASAPLVLGYNPRSRFAAQIEPGPKSRPWYEVVTEPGFLLGRTDPKLDPKGRLTAKAIEQAETAAHAPRLAGVLTSTSSVFPEESLVGELQSGQLDAGFFYSNEAMAAGIPTVPLSPVHLSASYTVTVVERAPHEAAAVAFVGFLYSPAGQRVLAAAGLVLAAPPAVVGPVSAVPLALRGAPGALRGAFGTGP